jgi:DNA-binding MarR family transcriptional regulator
MANYRKSSRRSSRPPRRTGLGAAAAQPPFELAERVHSAAVRLLRRLRRQDAATGLSAARLSALSVVVFGGPVTAGRLAAAEQVSAPTMSRLLDGLVRDGYVKRERDRGDGRVTWVRATRRGERVLREGRRRRVEALARQLAGLGAGDRVILARAAALLESAARGG